MPRPAMDKEIFSVQEMRDAFSYEPETGALTRRHNAKNGPHKAGSKAGYVSSTGHIRLKYKGQSLLAHRVAWAVHHGEWPTSLVDHISGDGRDNRILNLREATHAENMRNRKTHRSSKSGVRGVALEDGRFCASISVNGKRRRLGGFDTLTEAAQAYASAALALHGAFGRTHTPQSSHQ